jgi:hypothetical protein
MKGYGFSIWLVPVKCPSILTDIITKYNDKPHVAHVTVQTNIPTIKEAQEIYRDIKYIKYVYVRVYLRYTRLSQMYEHDPIKEAWGFPAEMINFPISVDHFPHMTICYGQAEVDQIWSNAVLELKCRLALFDTTSMIPWEWHEISTTGSGMKYPQLGVA